VALGSYEVSCFFFKFISRGQHVDRQMSMNISELTSPHKVGQFCFIGYWGDHIPRHKQHLRNVTEVLFCNIYITCATRIFCRFLSSFLQKLLEGGANLGLLLLKSPTVLIYLFCWTSSNT
jgi:hypothetical protein